MTKTEQREMAKNILMAQLATAHYQLENLDNLELYTDVSQDEITQKDLNQAYEYLRWYGKRMAKAIGEEFYQV